MKYFLRGLFFCISLVAFLTDLKGQEAILPVGGDLSGSGGTVSYSIGQAAYITSTGINGSVAQGVQQAYEISVLTATDDFKNIDLTCKVYPNPTTDLLYLNVDRLNVENMIYQLYDMKGQLLINNEIDEFESTIPMGEFASSTYFLHVIINHIDVKTFKIVKN